MLLAAPPVRELEWNDAAVEGAFRFLKRIWERSERVKPCASLPIVESSALSKQEKFARKKVYEALQKSHDIFSKKQSGYAFNTLIAACMEAFNALNEQDNEAVYSEGYFILLHILEPIVPHICWELSERYFGRANFAPIALDTDALRSDEILIAITVNGKKRAEIEVSADISNEDLLALGKQSVAKWLNGEIIKEIVVPKKLINFVLKA